MRQYNGSENRLLFSCELGIVIVRMKVILKKDVEDEYAREYC